MEKHKTIQEGLEWLEKSKIKDRIEIDRHKKALINEIKSLDRNKMFEKLPKEKKSLLKKILIIFGYGSKKR